MFLMLPVFGMNSSSERPKILPGTMKNVLRYEPIITDAGTFFPHRHNEEFTLAELELLFNKAGFLASLMDIS